MRLLPVTPSEYQALRKLAGEHRITNDAGEMRLQAASWDEGVRKILGPIPEGDYELRVCWWMTDSPPFHVRIAHMEEIY